MTGARRDRRSRRAQRRAPRPGPHAVNTWRTASLAKQPGEVIAAAFAQAEARDPDHRRTWLVLVDGDPHQIERIRAEATRRAVEVHIICDVVHVIEYIWTAAWCFHAPGDPAAEDWVAARVLQILTGHATEAADSIAAQAEELAPEHRGGAETAVRYLRRHAEFLCYDTALARGWPIATGVIEGTARHLIADRFEIGGARWSLDGAEALLTLRALIDNGDFPRYWPFHLAREHQRIHPDDDNIAA